MKRLPSASHRMFGAGSSSIHPVGHSSWMTTRQLPVVGAHAVS